MESMMRVGRLIFLSLVCFLFFSSCSKEPEKIVEGKGTHGGDIFFEYLKQAQWSLRKVFHDLDLKKAENFLGANEIEWIDENRSVVLETLNLDFSELFESVNYGQGSCLKTSTHSAKIYIDRVYCVEQIESVEEAMKLIAHELLHQSGVESCTRSAQMGGDIVDYWLNQGKACANFSGFWHGECRFPNPEKKPYWHYLYIQQIGCDFVSIDSFVHLPSLMIPVDNRLNIEWSASGENNVVSYDYFAQFSDDGHALKLEKIENLFGENRLIEKQKRVLKWLSVTRDREEIQVKTKISTLSHLSSAAKKVDSSGLDFSCVYQYKSQFIQ